MAEKRVFRVSTVNSLQFVKALSNLSITLGTLQSLSSKNYLVKVDSALNNEMRV